MSVPMRAVASAAARSSAVGKRLADGPSSRPHVAVQLIVRTQSARFHSKGDAPSKKNPFEIHFHPDDEDAIFTRRTPNGPSKAGGALPAQETEVQDEIRSLHAEMAGIFGEELEEYDSSSSSSEDTHNASSQEPSQPAARAFESHYNRTPASSSLLDSTAAVAAASHEATRAPASQPRTFHPRAHFDRSHIAVLQGPCSYVQDVAIGSNKPKHELLGEIYSAAAQLGASVTCRDSNHEGEILDWLLSADPGSSVVLCWNARLSESPMVIRALELLERRAVAVVVVSPLGLEHGPLPASVRGVVSGLDANAVPIALHAASTLDV